MGSPGEGTGQGGGSSVTRANRLGERLHPSSGVRGGPWKPQTGAEGLNRCVVSMQVWAVTGFSPQGPCFRRPPPACPCALALPVVVCHAQIPLHLSAVTHIQLCSSILPVSPPVSEPPRTRRESCCTVSVCGQWLPLPAVLSRGPVWTGGLGRSGASRPCRDADTHCSVRPWPRRGPGGCMCI